MLNSIVIILFLFMAPLAVVKLTRRYPVVKKCGTVTLCFILGLIINLIPWSYDKALVSTLTSVLVAIAIPIMLFGINILEMRKTAGIVIKAFALQIFSAVAISTIGAVIANALGMDFAAELSGMTTGLYIGGTPNLLAVGDALTHGDMNIISALVVSDTILGSIYFITILTVGKRFYMLVLGQNKSNHDEYSLIDDYDIYIKDKAIGGNFSKKDVKNLVIAVLLAVACFGIGVLLEIIINGNLDGSLFIIMVVSILGIIGGMIRPLREVKGNYQVGQYLIVVFSMGLGASIDFSILGKQIKSIFLFCLLVQLGVGLAHLLLCKLFKIDADTAIITSIAGIFGPPFVVPVAEILDDRKLMAPGVICGIVGLAIGNIVGLGMGLALMTIL